jgi:hypothetical protein
VLTLPRSLQGKRYVVKDIQVWIKGVKLKDKGDVSVAGPETVNGFPIDENLSAVNLFKSGNGAENGCLPTSRRPQEHQIFPIFNLKVELSNDVVFIEIFFDIN